MAENNRQALALVGLEPPSRTALAQPVPRRHGEPSPIKHVIYIIKENRTYDQVFGDIKEGNGDPALVMFGREVTPNQHALAREFVLLDNYLLRGRAVGRWPCLGDRSLCHRLPRTTLRRLHPQLSLRWRRPSGLRISGFLWDNALAHGKTFRDYGEFIKARITPPHGAWEDLYADYRQRHLTN